MRPFTLYCKKVKFKPILSYLKLTACSKSFDIPIESSSSSGFMFRALQTSSLQFISTYKIIVKLKLNMSSQFTSVLKDIKSGDESIVFALTTKLISLESITLINPKLKVRKLELSHLNSGVTQSYSLSLTSLALTVNK